MSPSKRRKIEEYHDPDYCQNETKTISSASDSERQDKIKMIIKREFLKEISSKEEEINLIDHKLNQTKRLLQRVRYAVAMSYYTKKNLVYSGSELKCENNVTETITSTVGQAIHPSLKKLLGKKPIDYEEILKSRSPRNAAKTARSTLIKSKKKGTAKPDKDVAMNEVKVPRYISPTKPDVQIEKINSSRGRHQTSHLIVVGNTSKYIGDEKSANEVTHKWLVYIKTKTPVEIEDMVSKVRFFLHPSYKPNDVIEVDSPPFQISRRGWGEFPVRVQLYFHESINQKPLQIYHNLILDKKLTGLQTMGAETVVEIWLDLPIPNRSKDSERKNYTKEIVSNHSTDKIDQPEAVERPPLIPPINIKMEEPLIINESPEDECHEELPATNVTTPEIHEKKSNTPTKSLPGCLNDISEIFRDAASEKINPPTTNNEKVNDVKVKTTPVLQKKTLVRCLDSNGKIVFVQLQVDPNNPKNIKIVKTPTVVASSQPTTAASLAKPTNINQFKLGTLMEQKRLVTPATSILSNVIASNSPKQLVQVKPITSASTSTNPRPIVVKTNTNLSRLNTVEAKGLLENKKLFIIKSSTLPNLNATNPPPLVRISNPTNKVVLAPSTANLKVIPPTPRASDIRKVTPINANSVIMKNGKIFILDKDKANLKPKQESLLKPQVSLLKPMHQKPIGDATSTKSILMPKPTPQIHGSRYRKQVPLNAAAAAAKRDYHKEFRTIFVRHRFQTVRSAVEYVLKNTPLVNALSSRTEFHAAFPFVAESDDKFSTFPFAKRRSNEWYRAKFAHRMLQQHPDLKTQSPWTTREILIFGRRFGYTPANTVNILNKQIRDDGNPLKDMIKQHIKEEQLKNVTITYNSRIKDFLEKYEDLTKVHSITSSGPLEIINVDGDDDDDADSETANIQSDRKPTEFGANKLVLDVNRIMNAGGMLVNDICHEIQIKLDKEEIVDGIICSSSQLVLWQAMRSFMEDLIRRAFASKPLTEQISNLSAERCVRVDDIRKAITATDNFSFLTNKHLGSKKSS